MEHKRISVASVVATSGGSALACAVLLSASVAIANPDAKPTSGVTGHGKKATPKPTYTYKAPRRYTGMDLPLEAAALGAPPMQATIEVPTAPEPDDGDDPRDTPPPVFFGEEIDVETDSIIYVIDHSGSMSIMAEPFEDENGNIVSAGSRLDRAKAELKRSIAALPDSFFFNIMFYDECVSTCWNKKQQASQENKIAAYGWIDQIQPDGWTNIGLATQTALIDKDNQTVIVLSDGSPNFIDCSMNYVGSFSTHQEMIRSENTQGATVNTFGIGISSDNDARTFMQKVAMENGGTYTEIN